MTGVQWKPPTASPSEVVFLSGAGISADAPTNGPVGLALTWRALEHAFLPEAAIEIGKAYETVGVVPPREVPRLEAVLDTVMRVHGSRVLADLLSDLRTAQPNDLHRFFAWHATHGGAHLTANFDTLIERHSPTANIIHFHGAMDASEDSVERLGATLTRIESGFDPAMRDRLIGALTDPIARTLVIVGYSGLDFFDMDPFVRATAQRLAAQLREVIWVHHDGTAPPGRLTTESPGPDAWPPMLQALSFAGTLCTWVNGQTTTLLTSFARQWGIPPVRQVGRGSATPWAARQPLTEIARAEATRALYVHMGMLRSHDALVNRCPALSANVDTGLRAEIAWQRGQHRAALRHWRELYAGPGPRERSLRLERLAACRWDRGAYLRAYIASARASTWASRAKDATAAARAAEMQARILVAAARMPGLGWLASGTAARRVEAQLSHLLESHVFDPATRVRLGDVKALLRNDPERHGGSGAAYDRVSGEANAEEFNQYESLSALLDYRRGVQRRVVASGTAEMTVDWVDQYRRGARFLGKDAAVHTIITAPGVAPLFSWQAGVRDVMAISGTPLHRARLLGVLVREWLHARGSVHRA